MEEVDNSLELLSYKLINECYMYCTKMIEKNISCKVRIWLSLPKEKFMNYYFFRLSLYYFKGDILYIIDPANGHGIFNHFTLCIGYLMGNDYQMMAYYVY